jgi:dTDP-4-amino-4,6-dideoxygalactose transaminase
MDAIMDIADRHKLLLIEDAAQGLMARFNGRALGTFGQLSTLSFHETKNVISGEGGALLINDTAFIERGEIIREKGTNRNQFFRGEVDRYTWVDVGSSYLPGEITAAFLWAQLEQAAPITRRRRLLWERYHEAFAEREAQERVRRPIVPPVCEHNAHMYYLLLPSLEARTKFIASLASKGIQAVFHYVPLHSSPAGKAYGRAAGPMPHTDALSGRLVRLPLWPDLGEGQDAVIEAVLEATRSQA